MNFNFEYKFGNSDLGNQVSKFVEIEVGCFDPVKFALIDWLLYRYCQKFKNSESERKLCSIVIVK